MKKNAMRKNLHQSIRRSFGRYIAIVMIIALGSSLFVGLLMTKSDMVATGQVFMDEQNMFDLRLMNSYGWTEEYLDDIAGIQEIVDVEPVIYLDLIARVGDADADSVYRFYELPEIINLPALRGGRMPEKASECLVDGFHMDDSILGKKVVIQRTNDEDSMEAVTYKTFTIVGYMATPLYMDMNRGTTTVGNGSLSNYFYVRDGVLDLDYIPEIHATISGDYAIYSEEYIDAVESVSDKLEPKLQILTERRLEEVREDAEEAYQDGVEELQDGWDEYHTEKEKVWDELDDAHQKLIDAEKEIEDNEKLLKDGEVQIADGRKLLEESEITLKESKAAFMDAKAAAYKQMANANSQMMDGYQQMIDKQQQISNDLLQVQTELISVNTQIAQEEINLSMIDSQIQQVETMISIVDISIDTVRNSLEMLDRPGVFAAETEPETGTPEDAPEEDTNAQREELQRQLEELLATRAGYVQQLSDLQLQRQHQVQKINELHMIRTQLENRNAQLEAEQGQLVAGTEAAMTGIVQLLAAQAQMENELASGEAQLESAQAKLEEGFKELALREKELKEGWTALEEGKQELADGWKEYEDGKQEAEKQLYDAWRKLKDAETELEEARETIDKMTENEPIILDRRSNVGYNNLSNSSDIVQGVSRVLPVFFLLVASLVCITTMTRMIDEERTQIGTLKALGYSNSAIIGKYLFYSGSGAIIGCGLGVLVGSTIFPMILWEAYKIMLYINPVITLTVNWWLCIAVVSVYTAVLLFVTWYCCRRTLREVPAELIRPKAPDAGKALLVEKLPFWKKISFLNKVMIRNIFRYRQRLAMMLVGIGGCTALLVTGFGLRDSIVNVVDFQFENITVYDMEVYFKEELSRGEQMEFQEDIAGQVQSMAYCHQSSVDLEYDNKLKEIIMISGGEELADFIHLHSGDTPVQLPQMNEVVLSVGAAEAMGISVGDTVTLRNSDMQVLELTVSGIYDNHVSNYAIVAPRTIQSHWGKAPEVQMAFLKIKSGFESHAVSAEVSSMSQVMNVSVSDDLADMVGNMMDALDLVVIVVVVCAGLLAATVLYNLTNININERIREIATIKVLGFNASETAAYVFKENMTLTVVGAVIGMFLGKLLLLFVMTQIKIDMVWFKAVVMPPSYIWAVALTMLSAVVVDYIFYFKLQKINMAEALKSVE